jgi:ABC-type transport system substrate-binding protein
LTDYTTGSAALNPAEGYKEAPMLAERVAAGKLPPVEQRLPKNPFVRHVPQIGKYGGTLYDQTGTPGGRFHFDAALIAGAQETDNNGQIIRPHRGEQAARGTLVPVVSTTTHDIYERNPYFAEVDQEGNQLPYIDRIYVQVVEDQKLQIARRATGAVSEGLCDMSQISIFTHNARRAGYAIKHWHLSNGSECMFAFNLNHKDPVKRRVYNDLKFRQALSYAINRRRINETLYFGQAKEWQATISSKVSYFDPKWVECCAAHDPAQANRLLDETGGDRARRRGSHSDQEWKIPAGSYPLAAGSPLRRSFASSESAAESEHWVPSASAGTL